MHWQPLPALCCYWLLLSHKSGRMIKQLLKGRFLGHPVHPMLVHFPTALFVASPLFDMLVMMIPETRLETASFWCMGLGLTAGIAAGVFGTIDLAKLASGDTVFSTALWHGLIQASALMGMGVIFGLRLLRYPEVAATSSETIATGILVLVMLAGNYMGGELVFRHGVGVDEKS